MGVRETGNPQASKTLRMGFDSPHSRQQRAFSSAVERLVDIQKAAGSIPARRTKSSTRRSGGI